MGICICASRKLHYALLLDISNIGRTENRDGQSLLDWLNAREMGLSECLNPLHTESDSGAHTLEAAVFVVRFLFALVYIEIVIANTAPCPQVHCFGVGVSAVTPKDKI